MIIIIKEWLYFLYIYLQESLIWGTTFPTSKSFLGKILELPLITLPNILMRPFFLRSTFSFCLKLFVQQLPLDVPLLLPSVYLQHPLHQLTWHLLQAPSSITISLFSSTSLRTLSANVWRKWSNRQMQLIS